jgi:hypothetical protein
VDVGGTGTPLQSVAEVRTPDTFRTASDLGIAVTRPIVIETDSRVDVEPVQVDLCLDVGLTKLPRACVQQPYDGRVGLTVFGAEVVGLRWAGRAEVILDDLADRPHVELGRAHLATGAHDDEAGLHVRLD